MDDGGEGAEEADCRRAEEPPRLPEGRFDGQRDAAPRLIPYPIFVAGFHLETVTAWRRQLGIVGDADVSRLCPGRLVPFQSILEADPLRSGEVQTGVMDLQAFGASQDGRSLRPRDAKAARVEALPPNQH